MKDVNDDVNGVMSTCHVVNDFHTGLSTGVMNGCRVKFAEADRMKCFVEVVAVSTSFN